MTVRAASSPRSGRTRCWRRSSSSPSLGTLAWAAIRSAPFPRNGRNGTTAIAALRRQLRRNQLACLLLAQGLPLLLAGDEVGNSQGGNNNAYCQDNEIGWVNWGHLGDSAEDFTGFIGHLTDLRRRFPQLKSHRWLDGRRADGSYGALWLTPAAEEMKEEDW